MIFDKNTPNETIEFVENIIKNINTNGKYGRHKWSTNISKVQVKLLIKNFPK